MHDIQQLNGPSGAPDVRRSRWRTRPATRWRCCCWRAKAGLVERETCRLDVVPLFETIAELRDCGQVLTRMLAIAGLSRARCERGVTASRSWSATRTATRTAATWRRPGRRIARSRTWPRRRPRRAWSWWSFTVAAGPWVAAAGRWVARSWRGQLRRPRPASRSPSRARSSSPATAAWRSRSGTSSRWCTRCCCRRCGAAASEPPGRLGRGDGARWPSARGPRTTR